MAVAKEKIIMLFSCIVGPVLVISGMVFERDGMFLLGLVFAVSGYLAIRKRLKRPPAGGQEGVKTSPD